MTKGVNESTEFATHTTTITSEHTTMTKPKAAIYFSKFNVTDQVFFKTKHTYALVNLKPITPGHILIVPLRTDVLHLSDLTPIETVDYFNALQKIHKFIKHIYKAESLNIAIQDGPEAGQSVPHLHTHVIPRYADPNNIGDRVYRELEKQNFDDGLEGNYDWWERRKQFREGGGFVVRPDGERVERSDEILKQEADWLKLELSKFYPGEENMYVEAQEY
ncbi:hypothetical protein WICPIJ_008491 [Wickerhamomyces pijperi]|uniref:Bis(5'-adenosyl)-triphosphatase n=1 Tax=Wickerhamomyces pijperi TaxID=599730 RepID=A0A9P8PYY5_WICPI|nr:hypothetical protein WICPIJ_008491 [Wickerhamomyces pijperi]